MKKILSILVLSSVLVGSSATLAAQSREERLSEHVYYLADDSMNGRKAGSADAAKAREYIISEYSKAGIVPFFDSGWEMPFMDGKYVNVVGKIEGCDPVLKNEYIVLGAHYDHIGVNNGKIYNGADDNASGTAALIEIARYLVSVRSQLKRSVIIAAFDAEELGLYGSKALSARLDDDGLTPDIKLMMSIDMVGWLKAEGKLTLEGVATIRNGEELLQAQADALQLPIKNVKFEKSIFTATDTEYFAKNQVPTLAVSTGLKSPYHKPEDDPQLIDYPGLDKVTGYIGNVTVEFANDPSLAASGRVAAKHRNSVRPVLLGLSAGAGSAFIGFDDAGFTGKTAFNANLGVVTRINFGKEGLFALQAECNFSQSKAIFPDERALYSSSLPYMRRSMTIPVQLLLHTPQLDEQLGLYVGLGGFWSKAFKETLDVPYKLSGDGYGIAFSFGFEIGSIAIEFDGNYFMNNLFSGEDAPKARLNTRVASLKYFF